MLATKIRKEPYRANKEKLAIITLIVGIFANIIIVYEMMWSLTWVGMFTRYGNK